MLGAGALLPILPGHPGIACPLRAATGIPCPLCGMTTSVEETVRLDLQEAVAANPAGVVAVAVALALLAVRPRRLQLPWATLPAALLLMWLWELHRFSIL
jgi:putative exporter of polyketide antibiotics